MSLSLVTILLLFLSLLFVWAILTWAHLRFWTRRLTLELDYTDFEQLITEDDAIIELRRTPIPKGAVVQPLPPVLLVHGLGANHRNQDVHPDYSLARFLAALGRDVWLLTLRSGRAPRSRAERNKIRFDAMASYDVPLAIRTVLERTGQKSLDYVGFSMGGMLLYASIGRTIPAAAIRRSVIVGSPGQIVVSPWVLPLARRLPRSLVPTLPLRLGARLIAFASEWMKTPLHQLTCNPHNISPGITRAALFNVIEDIPGPLYADFAEWAVGGGTLKAGSTPVLDHLAEIEIPALFIAGAADRIAPIASVRAAFEAWGKHHPELPKRMVVAGRDFGHHEDYGHGDMALGAHVGVDLFEPIAKFLGPEHQAHEVLGPEEGKAARDEIRSRDAVVG